MSQSNWDKVLEDVGLATPAKKPVIEPVAEQIAVPVSVPATKPALRRVPSFGSGILDDTPEPTPTPDLVADIEATAAKSSSFFDMLPSLNPFSAFGKKPAVVPPKKVQQKEVVQREPRREHRVESNERVDDPWTDVATQISGVVASRRDQERERPRRKERAVRETPREESPKTKTRIEDGLSWKDAVGVVVAANVARRRRR